MLLNITLYDGWLYTYSVLLKKKKSEPSPSQKFKLESYGISLKKLCEVSEDSGHNLGS